MASTTWAACRASGPSTWPGADAPYHEELGGPGLALNLITGFERIRVSNGRALREEMPPAEYLAAGYFDRWIWSTEHGAARQRRRSRPARWRR